MGLDWDWSCLRQLRPAAGSTANVLGLGIINACGRLLVWTKAFGWKLSLQLADHRPSACKACGWLGSKLPTVEGLCPYTHPTPAEGMLSFGQLTDRWLRPMALPLVRSSFPSDCLRQSLRSSVSIISFANNVRAQPAMLASAR